MEWEDRYDGNERTKSALNCQFVEHLYRRCGYLCSARTFSIMLEALTKKMKHFKLILDAYQNIAGSKVLKEVKKVGADHLFFRGENADSKNNGLEHGKPSSHPHAIYPKKHNYFDFRFHHHSIFEQSIYYNLVYAGVVLPFVKTTPLSVSW